MSSKYLVPLVVILLGGCRGVILPGVLGDWDLAELEAATDNVDLAASGADGSMATALNGDAQMSLEFVDFVEDAYAIDLEGEFARDGGGVFDVDLSGEIDSDFHGDGLDADSEMSCEVAGPDMICVGEVEFDGGPLEVQATFEHQ